MFQIAQISDQINSNPIAWANTVQTADSLSEAKIIADKLYNDDWENVPEGCSLGYTYMIHDGVNVY